MRLLLARQAQVRAPKQAVQEGGAHRQRQFEEARERRRCPQCHTCSSCPRRRPSRRVWQPVPSHCSRPSDPRARMKRMNSQCEPNSFILGLVAQFLELVVDELPEVGAVDLVGVERV